MPRRNGFTLLEILVVLTILGIVLGVVITRGPMRSEALEARAAAGTLAQGLRSARAQAIVTNRVVSVAIDPGRHEFETDNHKAVTLPKTLRIAVLPGAIAGPGRVRVVRFGEDGSASGGRILLGRGARSVAVTVEWLTGQVSTGPASPDMVHAADVGADAG